MLGLETGFVFGGRYKILKPIGAGGMGAVYLACDARYEDFMVALKVLYPGIIKTPEARERFRNEIVASYRVNHPNIVRAFEYFDEDELQAFAMEYVDGGDLLERIKTGGISISEGLVIMRQVASGLVAIHKEGIVHRDLKPENIMLTKKGVAKITDFGVARLRGAVTLTKAGAMVGTPKYLSPEYVETGECDARGDLYAWGVIAYEMIAGSSPFTSHTNISLMVERLKQKAAPLAEVAPHCPPSLAKVVEKAMSISVSKRYQTAQELVADLDLVAAGKDVNFSFSDLDLRNYSSDDISVTDIIRSQALHRLKSEVLPIPSNRQYLRSTLMISAAFVLAFLAGIGYRQFKHEGRPRFTLSDLPAGNYGGTIKNPLGDNRDYTLRVWRTDAGAYVFIGKDYCRAVPIDSRGRFACGDLQFSMSVSSVERKTAVGTVNESSWDTAGTWSLSADE